MIVEDNEEWIFMVEEVEESDDDDDDADDEAEDDFEHDDVSEVDDEDMEFLGSNTLNDRCWIRDGRCLIIRGLKHRLHVRADIRIVVYD